MRWACQFIYSCSSCVSLWNVWLGHCSTQCGCCPKLGSVLAVDKYLRFCQYLKGSTRLFTYRLRFCPPRLWFGSRLVWAWLTLYRLLPLVVRIPRYFEVCWLSPNILGSTDFVSSFYLLFCLYSWWLFVWERVVRRCVRWYLLSTIGAELLASLPVYQVVGLDRTGVLYGVYLLQLGFRRSAALCLYGQDHVFVS